VELGGLDELGGFAFGFGQDPIEDLVGWEIFIAQANIREGFIGSKSAALATADVVKPEEGSAGSRDAVEDFLHGHGGRKGGVCHKFAP
jgi:hypothetical protein